MNRGLPVIIVFLAVGTAGCDLLSPASAVPHAVELDPDSLSLVETTSADLTATVRDAAGRGIVNVPVVWTSSDSSVAQVSSEGKVTAREFGTATITAAVHREGGEPLSAETKVVVRRAITFHRVGHMQPVGEEIDSIVFPSLGAYQEFIVSAHFENGHFPDGIWIDDDEVASLHPSPGGSNQFFRRYARSEAAGETRLYATIEGRTSWIPVRVELSDP